MKTALTRMLWEYAHADAARFHMPGHKGGRGMEELYEGGIGRWDITELPFSDNLLNPEGVLREAQREAAVRFGARRTFFLVNGSSAGVTAMMLALPQGSKVILQRNAHRSALSGVILAGHRAAWVWPQYDGSRGIYGAVSPQGVAQALEQNPDASALFLTRPDYYGRCCDGEAIAALCRERGVLLLVDEAHGAHFSLGKELPESASAFADLWVQSAHKTLPCPNQGGYLHLGRGGKPGMPTPGRLAYALSLVQTTSPSYPLMAALDMAWRMEGWDEQARRMDEFCQNLPEGVVRCGADSAPAVADWDRTRLVLDVTGRGITGWQAEAFLRERGILLEMAEERCIVAITSPLDEPAWYDRLREGLFALPTGNHRCGEEPPPWSGAPKRMEPRAAALAQSELVPLTEAAGRVSAGSVGLYPPGSPVVAPGEAFTGEAIRYLLRQRELGASLFGVQGGMAACVLESGEDPACGWREGLTYCCLDSERQGTCYFEFQRGRNPGRFWRTSSIYMEDEVFDRLNLPELFAGALPDFDYYGETEVTPEQWDRIKTGAERMGPQTRAAISELDGWAQACFAQEPVFRVLGL